MGNSYVKQVFDESHNRREEGRQKLLRHDDHDDDSDHDHHHDHASLRLGVYDVEYTLVADRTRSQTSDHRKDRKAHNKKKGEDEKKNPYQPKTRLRAWYKLVRYQLCTMDICIHS